ncbi:MAG: Gmad2 immunoglobulin-like domain-containing protein [Candidatus Vogelbacteria bacterium]|nr:Gmad2 immunoglobulin-like domain-containing protein [Candidatus Vogelbacteria bacterium]
MIMLGGGAFWFKSQSDDLLQATTDSRIRVTTPRAGDSISSPLSITGEARGTWFFEASFPVVLTDWDGLIIAQGVAQAQSEWMTEEFVPFQAALNFTKPNNGNPHGTLILQRDNPSGLSQNDAAVEIPILFK